ADLKIVPVAGWHRSADIMDTGLPFVPPSPNLRSIESLFHHPGTCLFEGTGLSVGRVTPEAFQQIGAPWLDTTAVLAIARKARLVGVRFVGVRFTPDHPGDGKHPGVSLTGIRLVLTDRKAYEPVRAALVLLSAVQAVHPQQLGFNPQQFDRL